MREWWRCGDVYVPMLAIQKKKVHMFAMKIFTVSSQIDGQARTTGREGNKNVPFGQSKDVHEFD